MISAEVENKNKSLWKDLVFDKTFLSKIDKLSLKRFVNQTVAEECSTYVIECLAKDNWASCEKYQGLSKPTTFLYSISVNFIEEFSRKKYGRPRPPVWLKNQGDLWVSIWKTLCLERQLTPTIIDRYKTKGFSEELISHAIKVIKARLPSCGCDTVGPQSFDSFDSLEETPSFDFAEPGSINESFLFEQDAGRLFHSMLESILGDDAKITPLDIQGDKLLDQGIRNKLLSLKESLTLTDQEKILIRMVFVDGLSKSKAARVLNIPSHQGGKVINATLERIKDAFRYANLDIDSLYNSLN